MRMLRSFLSIVVLTAAAAGCGGSLPVPSCNLAAQTGCGAGLVCEAVATGGTVCTAPVVVRGHVFSLAEDAPIEGARVVALDANRAPISNVAITADDGSFSIRISSPRAANGLPVDGDVLLRADARGYATFPSGVRQAFPVSTATGILASGAFVISGPQTEIGLEALAGAGTASIRGVAAVAPGAPGVLVVAERQVGDGTVGASALADRDGDYAIFNLPAGAYTVRAFARGAVHAPQSQVLADAQDALVDVPISGPAGATVAGSVQLVNPGTGTGTSVILVVESTFDEKLARGESPPGLRAPGGLVPDLKGAYAIAGVPPGRYVALAAFENDLLVRDPDLCIGGTQIVHLDVPQTSGTVTLDGFKVTGSLDVISPGASQPEVVSATPVFTWQDDSSEDAYDLTVIDSHGNEVWSTPVPGESGVNPSVAYGGPQLLPGYYQFKVRSSNGTCVPAGQTDPVTKFLSQTEDLKGVFIVP